MRGITCCKNCSDRFVGCHSTCLKYIDEKQKYEVLKQEEYKEKQKREMFKQTITNGDFLGNAKHHRKHTRPPINFLFFFFYIFSFYFI